jgi:hypothetical protein
LLLVGLLEGALSEIDCCECRDGKRKGEGKGKGKGKGEND